MKFFHVKIQILLVSEHFLTMGALHLENCCFTFLSSHRLGTRLGVGVHVAFLAESFAALAKIRFLSCVCTLVDNPRLFPVECFATVTTGAFVVGNIAVWNGEWRIARGDLLGGELLKIIHSVGADCGRGGPGVAVEIKWTAGFDNIHVIFFAFWVNGENEKISFLDTLFKKTTSKMFCSPSYPPISSSL